MSYVLYGFVEVAEERDFGVAAVTGAAPCESLEGLSKERLVPILLQHQRKLEEIMKTQFILPCKFGTLLKDETESRDIVLQNAPVLKKWLRQMKSCCEMEVVAMWDPPAILQEIARTDPEIAKLKNAFAALSPEEQQKNKMAIGIKLSARLKEQAERTAKQILENLQAVSRTWAPHPLMNDAMVFNASFLLDRRAEGAIFEALKSLDKHFEGKLYFKCVGPLPPYSFATAVVKRFDPGKIEKARQTLGLNGVEDLKAVQKIYKAKARRCHPDTHPGLDAGEFDAIHQAYEILTDYHRGGAKPIQVSLVNVSEEIK